MSIDIFKSCAQAPKSGKNFWKGQGILKCCSAAHPVLIKIQKRILMYYDLWTQIIKSVLAPVWSAYI